MTNPTVSKAKKRRAKTAPSSASGSNDDANDAASATGVHITNQRYAESIGDTAMEILKNLLEIATSPTSRSVEMLNAFMKEKCVLEHSSSAATVAAAAAASSSSSPATLTRSSSSSVSSSPSQAVKIATTSSSHLDCYWIVLATNILNRLLTVPSSLSSSSSNDTDSASTPGEHDTQNHLCQQQQEHLTYMVALSDIMTAILLVDKNKLEKASHPTTSRNILTRAILTATESCKFVVEHYATTAESSVRKMAEGAATAPASTQQKNKKKKTTTTTKTNKSRSNKKSDSSGSIGTGKDSTEHPKNPIGFDTLSAAVAILDRLVYFKSSAEKGAECLSLALPWKSDDLKAACIRAEVLIGTDIAQDRVCVMSLLDTLLVQSTQPNDTTTQGPSKKKSPKLSNRSSSSTSPPPTKRQARGDSQSATHLEGSSLSTTEQSVGMSPIVSSFQSLLETSEFRTRIDGRVSIKRWASIPLVWSVKGDGQLKMFQAMDRISELPTTTAEVTQKEGMTLSRKSDILLRLMDIVAEAGNICLARPPSGGIDEYLKCISTSHTDALTTRSGNGKKSESKKKARGSSSPKSPQRIDVRDWAIFVIFKFLQCHRDCLLSAADDGLSFVNDSLDGGSAFAESRQIGSHSSAILSPNAGTTIAKVCRSVSSNGINSNYSKQAESTKIMMGIVVAQSIEMISDQSLPLDCKLAQFALANLAECIRIIGLQSHGVRSSDTSADVERFNNCFSLMSVLPSPVTTAVVESFDGTNEKCAFGGMLPQDTTEKRPGADEQTIALVIRALRRHNENPTGMFWTFLIDLIQRIYENFGSIKHDDTDDGSEDHADAVSSQHGGRRKRKVRSLAVVPKQRVGQKRKAEHGEVAVETAETVLRRLTPARCSVATEALNVLRFCLSKSDQPSWTLNEVIRKDLTTDHLVRLVKLGDMLEGALLAHRDESSSNENASSNSERTLYAAHINMCKVLGRGRLYFEAEGGPDEEIWGSFRRLRVYQSMNSTDRGWPLAMPAAHKAFLMASLSCMPKSGDKIAERYLVNAFVDSVSERLKARVSSSSDERVPISYSDCRYFLTAFIGLPNGEKGHLLERLVNAAADALKQTEAFEKDPNTSGFLARVLVLLVAMMQSIRNGCTDLEAVFMGDVGRSDIVMPEFHNGKSGDWYTREISFMGLFDDWESASLPEVFANRPVSFIRSGTQEDLKNVLEKSFSLGFKTANNDRGRLLFTSWNQLDQLPSSSFSSTRLVAEVDDLARRILEMREDVCIIQGAIQKKDDSIPPSRLRQMLKDMVSKSCTMIDASLDTFVPKDDTSSKDADATLPLLAFLSTIPVYVAAAISGFTNPGDDYFSESLKRPSSYNRRPHSFSQGSDGTSDGESAMDMDDYDHDAMFNTLARLHACSDALGAAPTHPDWLDSSCSLRNSIEYDDIVALSEIAMRGLSRLMFVSMKQSKKLRTQVAEALCRNKGEPRMLSTLCVSLLELSNHAQGNSWENYISDVTDVPVAFMAEGERYTRDLDKIKASWVPNTGQRLRGYLQNGCLLKEFPWNETAHMLRAAGEWELLMSESLVVSCVGMICNSKDPDADLDDVADTDTRLLNAKAYMWKMVTMAAAQNMAPVAALLRFGISKGGRSRHPLSKKEVVHQDPHNLLPKHFFERPNSNLAPFSTSSTISTCLTLLARLSVDGDEMTDSLCNFISSHLVVDSRSFDKLKQLLKLRCSFVALHHLIDSTTTRGSKKKRKNAMDDDDGTSGIIDGLFYMIQVFGRTSTEYKTTSTSSPENRYPMLSAYFSKDCISIETLVEKTINFESILSQSKWTGKWTDFEEDRMETFEWFSVHRHTKTIIELVKLLFTEAIEQTVRCSIAELLSVMAQHEFYTAYLSKTMSLSSVCVVIPAIRQGLEDHFSKKGTSQKLLNDLEVGCTLSEHLSTILSLMLSLSPQLDSVHFGKAEDVLALLLKINWSTVKQPRNLINLILSYALRFNRLLELSKSMLSCVASVASSEQASEYLELLTAFFSAIKNLKMAMESGSNKDIGREVFDSEAESERQRELLAKLPKTCSYQSTPGFTQQHWYHCSTCGLTEDRGCCLLCALVCHSGHDVQYSRFSSFFCDCGAPSDDGNDSECKCQSALSESRIISAFEKENVSGWLDGNDEGTKNWKKLSDGLFLSIDIAAFCFQDTAWDSVKQFCNKSSEMQWLEPLFSLLKHQTILTADEIDSALHELLKSPDLKEEPSQLRLCPKIMDANLRRRTGVKCDFVPSPTSFAPVVAVQGISALYSCSSSLHTSVTKKLSRHESFRSIMDVDSRGRIVMAELFKLVWCTLPTVTMKPGSALQDMLLSKHDLAILGTSLMPFGIVGIKICPENDRLVCVHGLSEAVVVVTSAHMNVVELRLSLDFEVGSHESGDCILGCIFVSQNVVVVWSARFCRIYDISCPLSEKVTALNEYVMNPETNIRSLSMVSTRMLVLMLDNGRIHKLHLSTAGGKVLGPKNIQMDATSCIPIATSGLVLSGGVHSPIPGSPEGLARTLGEGIGITFLKQSRLLLYQTKGISSPVMGIFVGDSENISDSAAAFEFLPYSLPADCVGGLDEASITGPYSYFTELGVVYDNDGGAFFRVAAVARSSSTTPKVIIIDFNGQVTRVNALPSRGSACSAFDMSSTTTFQGLCCFSSPMALETTVVGNGRNRILTAERTFLAGITSSGYILLWGESVVDAVPVNAQGQTAYEMVSLSSCESEMRITPPLSIFEHMTNISETDDVQFCVPGLDSAEIKKSIMRETSPFACPTKEGSTLVVAFKATNKAIAGIRILVGSSGSSLNPSCVSVMGRQKQKIPITANKQQWVNLPLTKEEIARGVRQSCVSLFIGPTGDMASRPLLDAVEIYAIDRPNYVEKVYFAEENSCSSSSNEGQQSAGQDQELLKTLDTLLIVAEMPEKVPQKSCNEQQAPLMALWSSVARNPSIRLLRKLHQLTDRFDPEQQINWPDIVVAGCVQIMDECEKISAEEGESSKTWIAIKMLVHGCLDCLLYTSMHRPASFFSSIQGMVPKSVAQRAYSLFRKALQYRYIAGFDALTRVLTQLGLAEAAMDVNSKLELDLIMDPAAVLSIQCEAIRDFVKDGCAAEVIQRIEAARVVAYACDSCECCPIKHQRYTLPEAHLELDLCESCYEEGRKNAETQKFSESAPVMIKGSSVVVSNESNENHYTLRCQDIQKMKKVAILSSGKIVEGQDSATQNSERNTSVNQKFNSSLLDALFSAVNSHEHGQTTLGVLLSTCLQVIEASENDEAWRVSKGRHLADVIVSLMLNSLKRQDKDDCSTALINALSKMIAIDRLFVDIVRESLTTGKSTETSPLGLLCSYFSDFIIPGSDKSFWETLSKESKINRDVIANARFTLADCRAAYDDGIFASKQKLQGTVLDYSWTRESSVDLSSIPGDWTQAFFGSTLNLLPAIGVDHTTAGIHEWMKLLSRIYMNPYHVSKTLSGKAMKAICKENGILWHDVRDHYVLVRHLESLYELASPLIVAGITVRDKARVCRPDWSPPEKSASYIVKFGDLIGTAPLISEDVLSEQSRIDMDALIDSLMDVCLKRSYWRRFCGLWSLSPTTERGQGPRTPAQKMLSDSPPCIGIFWIACCTVTGNTQAKLLKLLGLAFTARSRIDRPETSSPLLGDANATDSTPEDAISRLIRDGNVSEDDLIAIAVSMIAQGKTTESRSHAAQVFAKVCGLPGLSATRIFTQLMPLLQSCAVGGKACINLLDALSSLLPFIELGDASLRKAAQIASNCFLVQLGEIKYGRVNGEWEVIEVGSQTKRRFDLSNCQFCIHNLHSSTSVDLRKSRSPVSSTTGRAANMSSISSTQWHPDQVGPFVRSKLDNCRDSSTGSEFCRFFKLTHRHAIHEIEMKINDARGRHVKTLNVYLSQRPLPDLNSGKWEKVATICVGKAASKAKASFPVTVASAVKVEFAEFYDRPGENHDTEDANSALLVFCPRCQTIVRNAHGVCHACGEMALQCRKCRNINYDRLDAFFCVECGYCPCGNFSFDILSGVATNAIAITNDKEYQMAMKMYGAAASITAEIKTTLSEKIRTILERKKSKDRVDMENFFPTEMLDAFHGLPPGMPHETSEDLLTRFDKPGSVVKTIARPEIFTSSDGAISLHQASARSQADDDILGLLSRDRGFDQLPSRQADGGSSRPKANPGDSQSSVEAARRKKEIEDCQKLHVLMRESSREAFELAQRIDAWKNIEVGSLVNITSMDFIRDQPFVVPCQCSICGPSVALHFLLFWWNLFLVSPSSVDVHNAFLDALLEEIPGQDSGLGDTMKAVVVSIVTKSEKGAGKVLQILSRRLMSSNGDRMCGEVLGKVLEQKDDFSMKPNFTLLAMETLSTL